MVVGVRLAFGIAALFQPLDLALDRYLGGDAARILAGIGAFHVLFSVASGGCAAKGLLGFLVRFLEGIIGFDVDLKAQEKS